MPVLRPGVRGDVVEACPGFGNCGARGDVVEACPGVGNCGARGDVVEGCPGWGWGVRAVLFGKLAMPEPCAGRGVPALPVNVVPGLLGVCAVGLPVAGDAGVRAVGEAPVRAPCQPTLAPAW